MLENKKVDWDVCLFERVQSYRLFAQQASSALWENSHMSALLTGEYEYECECVCSLRNGLTQSALQYY